jgi:3-keto-L-gulonate-6-phosphate decarboxylase
MQKNVKNNPIGLIFVGIFILFQIQPILGIIGIVGVIFLFKKYPKLWQNMTKQSESAQQQPEQVDVGKLNPAQTDFFQEFISPEEVVNDLIGQAKAVSFSGAITSPSVKTKLEKNKKYLQVALNGTLGEAKNIIRRLPNSEKILIEAGTPLIKIYGEYAIKTIRAIKPFSYIVADTKTSDLGDREVEMVARAGADAATCLGVAPVETINEFIDSCRRNGIDSMIDLMNVEQPLLVIKKLKQLPTALVLHRGVDETEYAKEKTLPFYQIKQIKGAFNVLVSVAGCDSINEVQSAIFNDADIVVVWKKFMDANDKIEEIVDGFLDNIK